MMIRSCYERGSAGRAARRPLRCGDVVNGPRGERYDLVHFMRNVVHLVRVDGDVYGVVAAQDRTALSMQEIWRLGIGPDWELAA